MLRRLVGIVALATVASGVAGAQRLSEPTWKFGGTLGLTLPFGDLGDVNGSGFHLTGIAQGKPAWFPLTVRGEAGFSTTGGKTIRVPGTGTTALTVDGTTFIQLSGNALYYFDTQRDATFKPYVIGGVGLGIGTRSVGTGLLVNAGGGFDMRLAGFDTFVEGKVQPIFGTDGGSVYLLPLSFGLRF
jgi:hypothetical protein